MVEEVWRCREMEVRRAVADLAAVVEEEAMRNGLQARADMDHEEDFR